ncbi:MAG: hypothetical protein ACO1OD_08860 [Croceibacterium sp.]
MLLLVPCALIGCGGPNVPAATAQSAATAINAITPKDLGGGAMVEAASTDGGVLVLKLDNVVEIGTAAADETTAAAVKVLACRDATYRTVVSQGIELRFDVTGTSGRKLPSVTLDKCP